MLREVLFLACAVVLLIAALYLIHRKVTALQVGEHTSRLVGTLCAIVAYYYLRHSFSLGIPEGSWSSAKLLAIAKVWLPPLALFGAAAYYTLTTVKNWHGEFVNLLKSSGWIVVVAVLVVLARYVLTK